MANYVRTHHDLVQPYVNALVKAVKCLHTAPNEEIVRLLPSAFYGGDKDIFDKVLTANKGNLHSRRPDLTPRAAKTPISRCSILAG